MKSSMQGTGDVISKTFMMSLVKLIGQSLIVVYPITVFIFLAHHSLSFHMKFMKPTEVCFINFMLN